MGLIKQWKEFREYQQDPTLGFKALLLEAGLMADDITEDEAINIPSVTACVELIANTIAILPIKLYEEKEGQVKVIDNDRVRLLNDDTKDTLDGFQFKKAIVTDYLLHGVGYAYINKERNNVKSLHYVDYKKVSVNVGVDPIFKSYDILVHGKTYKDFEFIKVTRKTKDGATGKGIIEENRVLLSVAYNSMKFENVLVKTGGNKKGFLKSQRRLSRDAMDELKAAWNGMYKNNTENVMVLNDGIDFQDSNNTSVELQLNENKKTNSTEICKLFNVPPVLLEGNANATEAMYNNFIKLAILPILNAIETALNKDYLLPSEKGSFYFAFDTKELLKGDMEKRYKAYELAVKNGFMQVDEVRFLENLEPLGLDFVKLGLQDVLYNPKTKEIYTPNTDKTASIGNLGKMGGGE